MKQTIGSLALAVALLSMHAGTRDVLADDAQAQRDLVNKGTVGVIAGSLTGTDLRLAVDLAHAFNDGYEIRVLPIVGEGSVRNIEDLLYLRGIDIAIVQSDVLDFYKRTAAIANIDERINYIAKLHDEEVHILARDTYQTVDDLAGRRVNFGPEGSGTFMTANIIFEDLGVDIDVQADPPSAALGKLRDGAIDALVFVDGAPIDLLEQIRAEEPLHLLEIPPERIKGAYLPATLTTEQYPSLINPGQAVQTVAIGEVLAAYNWPAGHPRRVKVSRFVQHFFADFERLLEPPYHPKWQEVDLSAEVPGWQRLPSANERLLASR